MHQPVHPIGRWLDLAGLLLFLAGATVYLYAWSGMRQLERGLVPASSEPFAAMARYDHLVGISRFGIGIFGAGIITAVAAVLIARMLRARAAGGASGSAAGGTAESPTEA